MTGTVALFLGSLLSRAGAGVATGAAFAAARPAVTAGVAAAVADASSLYNDRDSFIVQNQNVSFPKDIKDTAYIHMRFAKYVRRSINDQPFFEPQNSIRLTLPDELADNMSVTYDTTSLGSLVGAGIEAAGNLPGLSVANPVESIRRIFQSGAGVAGGIGVAAGQAALATLGRSQRGGVGGFIAGQAASAVSGLSALTGITPNPYQTVLFKSPNFKKHRFSWKFIPRNKDESNDIEFIIRLFKYHMLPGISIAGGLFFSYPEILQIKLFPADQYLYKFKPCVVDNVTVNYAPGGLSFYKNTGAPVAVSMAITLQEIEIWTKADFIRAASGRTPFRTPATNTSPNLRIPG